MILKVENIADHIISERLWNADQSWNFELIIKHDDLKLRVIIRRNAFDMQSYARVERWDGSMWKHVINRSIGECHCKDICYVQKEEEIQRCKFTMDAMELLDIALQVVQ